ncbi:transposase, partial [uncultured Massilia sp.]|uniref:transposase n=1 Tax=uncultured Massilia sp. TaxID=169973 RepID=UPI0025D59E4A
MSRTDLTEQQWRQLELHLPSNPHHGHAYVGHRHVINGVLWRLRTGAPWRDIPPRYGPW